MSKYWKIPPDCNAEFVAKMENVLETYTLPYNSKFPVVCMDESSKQLIGEVTAPIPAAPGHPHLMDNLNTHSIASLYAAFQPHEARRLAERLEIRHTPKHGSWLNVAEIELSVYKRQCIAGRIDCVEKMQTMTKHWNEDRNNCQAKVKWQFTTSDARIKLERLYQNI